jgi:aryl-alcohol dehydrogenase-like predicted oxidoreductase
MTTNAAMEYAHIDGIEKAVSRLVQGTVMLNARKPEPGFDVLDAVFAQGCNTFDAAHVYGNGACERLLGQWIEQRNLRDDVVIIDKGAHHNADRHCVTPFDISAHLHDSLARLRTDYIDLYLLHRDEPSVDVGPIMEALNEHYEAGRIHAFGASNWSAERIQEANAYAEEKGLCPFAVSSPHFSLAKQVEEPWDNCVSITGDDQVDERAWYEESQFPVFCWSSLAGGWFTGRLQRDNADKADKELLRCYGSEENWKRLERVEALGRERDCSVAQIAVAYVLNHPMNTFALVAAYKPEEFQSSTAALDIELTPQEMAWLDLRSDSPR